MLRVVTNHQPPLVFVEQRSNATEPSYSGFLVDLLPQLLQQAGINSSYAFYTIEGSGGVQLNNGSWTGIMGELTSGRADLALFPLTLTATREPHIQHIHPYMDGGYGILVKTQRVEAGYSFLSPFEGFTWAMVFAAMLLVVLLLIALDFTTRKARLHALEKNLGKAMADHRRKRDRMMDHAIQTVMMAVNSGEAPRTRSCSVKVMFVAWAIFCVIMLSAYTANLTANFTVNQLAVPLQTLADLAQMKAAFAVPAASSVSAFFAYGVDKTARLLRSQMVEYNSTGEAVADVRRGKIAAYISDFVSMQYFTQVPPCDLALGTEVVGSGSLVIGLQPNSTLAPQLNTAMLQLGENGMIPELKRKWFDEASQCGAPQDSPDSGHRLSMAQVWSTFLILAAGMLLGVVVAVLEVVYYNKLFAGVHQLKRSMSMRRGSIKGNQRSRLKPDSSLTGSSHSLDIETPEDNARQHSAAATERSL